MFDRVYLLVDYVIWLYKAMKDYFATQPENSPPGMTDYPLPPKDILVRNSTLK